MVNDSCVIGLTEVAQRFSDSCLFCFQRFNLSEVFQFEIFANDQQIESYFLSAFLYSTLDLLLGKLDPIFRIFVFADEDGAGLKSIEFVKGTFVRDVAHKVINVCLFLLLAFILLEDKRLWSAETVVELADWLGVAEDEPSVLC